MARAVVPQDHPPAETPGDLDHGEHPLRHVARAGLAAIPPRLPRFERRGLDQDHVRIGPFENQLRVVRQQDGHCGIGLEVRDEVRPDDPGQLEPVARSNRDGAVREVAASLVGPFVAPPGSPVRVDDLRRDRQIPIRSNGRRRRDFGERAARVSVWPSFSELDPSSFATLGSSFLIRASRS